METDYNRSGGKSAPGLLDLPIRDGNIANRFSQTSQGCAFRPSYQGWKLELFNQPVSGFFLLDLPIRDGNSGLCTTPRQHRQLLDLPIRDGNPNLRPAVPMPGILLDLPIRDGNAVICAQATSPTFF